MITRKEFAKAMDDHAMKIIQFLAGNTDKAYTDKEIAGKMKIDLRTCFLLLVDLKLAGVIVGKSIKGLYYYSVTDQVATQVQSGEFDVPHLGHKDMQPDLGEDTLRYIG